MDIGDELKAWLQDTSKPIVARIEFALKVWQSLDLAYPNKYEVVIQWLTQTVIVKAGKKEKLPLPVPELKQLFQLRAQPGLVCAATKTALIEALLQRVASDEKPTKTDGAELLQAMLNFELLQDALRADYALLMRSYGALFKTYERFLNQDKEKADLEFALPLLQQFRDYVQRTQHLEKLRELYDAHALQPLAELILQLRGRGLSCFAEFAALEKQLTEGMDNGKLMTRIEQQPLHVHLLTLECAVLNRQYEVAFVKLMLFQVFVKLFKQTTPQLALTIAAYTLEALRQHGVSLQFYMYSDDKKEKKQKGKEKPAKEEEEDEQESEEDEKEAEAKSAEKELVKEQPRASMTALKYVGNKLLNIVRLYRQEQLREVLLVLCAALRLNPMLVEENVYQITVWLLATPKRSAAEGQLYSEYLVQLLDMFRRLSRAERFVMNLLKALREWLAKYELKTGDKLKKEEDEQIKAKRRRLSEIESEPKLDIYLQLLFAAYIKVNESTLTASSDGFERLSQTWPSQSVGVAFTKLISHLMAKPSIVIWKTLLHALAELLDEQKGDTVLSSNLDFAIELHAALLCQYFKGSRLAEQLEQHQPAIEQQRSLSGQLLQQFGRQLLKQEHNRRSMNAYLECIYSATSFDLLLGYYWPDGLAKPADSPLQLHRFLPPNEWTLIQQRVHNFGKSGCRRRLQSLELQLAQRNWLLGQEQEEEVKHELPLELMPCELLSKLTREQKQQRLKRDSSAAASSSAYLADADCVELWALSLLEDYAALQSSPALLSTLKFADLQKPLDESALQALANTIQASKSNGKALAESAQLVEQLQQLPLAQLSTSVKSKLWLLIFALYRDVRQEEEQAEALLELLIDLLHFGAPLPICSYLPQLAELLTLLPLTTAAGWRFYETLFARCVKRQGAGSEQFLTSCTEYLRQELAAEKKLRTDDCRLLLLAMETLSTATGLQGKKLQQRHLQPLLEIYGEFVTHKFRSKKKEPAAYKEFVATTISGYATYVSACINRKESETIDDNFRRICKIYLGHSLNYRNAHAIRLLNVALTHRLLLHLDQDEIEFVLNSYWRQLNQDIEKEAVDMHSIEPAIKLIIGYKTNEDFLLLLRRLGEQVEQMPPPQTPEQHTSLQNVLTLLALFAKCSLSSIKGAILNEHFEHISAAIALRLSAVRKDVNSSPAYRSHLLRLLEAQRALAGNRTVPLTGDTLDSMLSTMLELDIKSYMATAGCWPHCLDLHAAITENCAMLLRQRGNLMSERVAQLTALFQDLLQAIVSYRSGQQQQQLSDTELDGLSDLALKLTTLMATIVATQSLAVKRVAPFLLVFTIKQMTSSERPTTLFEKIKVHVERICQQLIGLCDHRSGHFILRASSEAGGRMYQNLLKEHDKYHKFRGKV